MPTEHEQYLYDIMYQAYIEDGHDPLVAHTEALFSVINELRLTPAQSAALRDANLHRINVVEAT